MLIIDELFLKDFIQKKGNKQSVITKRTLRLAGLALVLAMTCNTASAKVVFAQTENDTSSVNGGADSDSDAFNQLFDDVTLSATATIRSVKWWGMYGPFNNTPVFPLSFQLTFYADSGGMPDLANSLGSTAVQFTLLKPDREIIFISNCYEFQANITPVAIPAGTKVWFSVFANTANDPDDSFLWREDELGNSAGRANSSGVITLYTGQRRLFVLYDTPVRPVTVLYNDDFSAASGLNATPPDVRPATEIWTASADWQANGTTASVNSTGEDDSAFLPFTPLPGKIYTLSATLKQPTGGYNTSAWAGIGFSASNSTDRFPSSTNNPSPWLYLPRSATIRTLVGPGLTGSATEATYTGLLKLIIVLDTTASNWTAEWFVGLRSLRKHTFNTPPTINYVGIAREDGVAVDFDVFSLTSEDGDIAPRIVSFSSVGGGSWDVGLAGNPSMPFEFRSSTNLVFIPGTLVENLSKGQPSDPGTVGGPNSSMVTTDDSGAAKVRMNLGSIFCDFVRAVALP